MLREERNAAWKKEVLCEEGSAAWKKEVLYEERNAAWKRDCLETLICKGGAETWIG